MENKITRLFEEQRINISDCSRKTGIPYGTLYDIAKGKTPFERVNIGYIIKIAHVFGMTADDLIGDAELDPDRYELCRIYDEMCSTGRRALLACAEALHDTFLEEMEDALNQERANEAMFDEGR